MNDAAVLTHSLCDAILGLQSQVSDVLETVGALLELATKSLPDGGRLDTHESGAQLAHYVVQLANTHARAQALVSTFAQLAAARSSLEERHARLHRNRWQRSERKPESHSVGTSESGGNS